MSLPHDPPADPNQPSGHARLPAPFETVCTGPVTLVVRYSRRIAGTSPRAPALTGESPELPALA
jgi:hypothetical protein